MEDVLIQIDDPILIPKTTTNQKTYLSVKRLEKTVEESSPKKQQKTKVPDLDRLYKNYRDFTRETFMCRMIEKSKERELVAKVTIGVNINYYTALRWRNSYKKKTEEVLYKESKENSDTRSSFTTGVKLGLLYNHKFVADKKKTIFQGIGICMEMDVVRLTIRLRSTSTIQ